MTLDCLRIKNTVLKVKILKHLLLDTLLDTLAIYTTIIKKKYENIGGAFCTFFSAPGKAITDIGHRDMGWYILLDCSNDNIDLV